MDIEKERLERKLSRKEVADRLGVKARTVAAWEQGYRNPSKQVELLVERGILDD